MPANNRWDLIRRQRVNFGVQVKFEVPTAMTATIPDTVYFGTCVHKHKA